jgi:N-acetylmuramoyl-L-alanine amidase
MRFGIDCGHNCLPEDTGAVGIKKEDVLTLDIGRKLIEKLTAAGHTAINCTPTKAESLIDSLRKRVEKANQSNIDIFISIHFNKFLEGTNITNKAMGCQLPTANCFA